MKKFHFLQSKQWNNPISPVNFFHFLKSSYLITIQPEGVSVKITFFYPLKTNNGFSSESKRGTVQRERGSKIKRSKGTKKPYFWRTEISTEKSHRASDTIEASRAIITASIPSMNKLIKVSISSLEVNTKGRVKWWKLR